MENGWMEVFKKQLNGHGCAFFLTNATKNTKTHKKDVNFEQLNVKEKPKLN